MLILIPHRREENLITSRFTTKTRGHGELPRDQVLSVSSVRTTVAVQCRAPRADVPSRRPWCCTACGWEAFSPRSAALRQGDYRGCAPGRERI